MWGKAVTNEQRPSTAPCLTDISILEGLCLNLIEGLVGEEGDKGLDEDGEGEEEVFDKESLKSAMMAGKRSGSRK